MLSISSAEAAILVDDDFQHIASGQNPRYRQALELRKRRSRDKQSRILIDGRREIELAAASNIELDEVYVDVGRLDDDVAGWLRRFASSGATVLTLTHRLMAKLGYGDRSDQIVATARTPSRPLTDLKLPPAAVVALLDGLEKPGNIGAIARSADAAAIDALVVTDVRTDLFNPNAIRSSRGTLFTVPIGLASIQEAIDWLRGQALNVCVARSDARQTYDQIDFRQGIAVVLGNESKGVSPIWREEFEAGIRLPLHGRADSLNVSATAAVLFYEADRQRRDPRPPST